MTAHLFQCEIQVWETEQKKDLKEEKQSWMETVSFI